MNLALNVGTADFHANIRPDSCIGWRNDRELCQNPSGISHWTEKRSIIKVKSGQNLIFDGEWADNFTKIRPESRIGWRNGQQFCQYLAEILHWTENGQKLH